MLFIPPSTIHIYHGIVKKCPKVCGFAHYGQLEKVAESGQMCAFSSFSPTFKKNICKRITWGAPVKPGNTSVNNGNSKNFKLKASLYKENGLKKLQVICLSAFLIRWRFLKKRPEFPSPSPPHPKKILSQIKEVNWVLVSERGHSYVPTYVRTYVCLVTNCCYLPAVVVVMRKGDNIGI